MARQEKRNIVKYLSGTAAVLSICFTCYSIYRAAATPPATVPPATTRIQIFHSNEATVFSWEQIPGSDRILPGALQPHKYADVQPYQSEPESKPVESQARQNGAEPQVAPAPKVTVVKPESWEYWAKVYVQGDSEGKSYLERRSCKKDRPLVCFLLPRWARDRIVIDAF